MIVHIPLSEMERAIQDLSESQDEVIGFFFLDLLAGPDAFKIQWHKGENVSPNPDKRSEISGAWLAEKIINDRLHPIAMLHSHPSGLLFPSEGPGGDFEMFPSMYVNVAFIWTKDDPGKVAQYTANRDVHILGIEEIFIHAI